MWKCPECGSTELTVTVEVRAILRQDPDGENFETEVEDGDHYWDKDSHMTCRGCGYLSEVRDFELEN